MPVSYEGVLVNYCMQSPASCMWDFTFQKVYDIAAPTFDEAVDPGRWKPSVASFSAKEEELEFPEIPCTDEVEAEVPAADNETSSGADLDPVDNLPPTPVERPILTPEVQPIPPST